MSRVQIISQIRNTNDKPSDNKLVLIDESWIRSIIGKTTGSILIKGFNKPSEYLDHNCSTFKLEFIYD